MNIKLYIVLILAVCVGVLGSCVSIEEPKINNSEYIEFVVRPTNFNSMNVSTKVSVAGFENAVHNCFFLLFDNNGNIVGDIVDTGSSLIPQRISRGKLTGGNTEYTACFVANVPRSILQGVTKLSQLNNIVLDIDYSSLDITDEQNSDNNSSFVIPEFDLAGNGERVQCLPMLGMAQFDLTSRDVFEIPLKRLFSKVSINVSLGQGITATYDLLSAHLINLPTKVKLTPAVQESAWVKEKSVFRQPIIEAIDVVNISSSTPYNKIYFYVPEYILISKPSSTENYGNERYKPRMFDESKFPVYLSLYGKYKTSFIGGEEKEVKYDLYLGEDASTSFSLKRNEHYINNIVINGITNSLDGNGSDNTLDCRVEIKKHELVEIYGQTANCYIIGGIGKYTFPACKGVHQGSVENIPEDLKCTKGTRLKRIYLDNQSIKLENLEYNSTTNEFSFEITEMGDDIDWDGNDGNVVLGLVYDEDGVEKTEWSWHIWVNSAAVWGMDFFEFGTVTYPNTFVMMDRNLGSRSSMVSSLINIVGAASGFYYKYGHKEPYIDGSYRGGGESANYTWSGVDKSQTDPCPPGYRVPLSNVWKSTSNEEPSKSHNILGYFEYWDKDSYPYNGFVNAKDELQESIDLSEGEYSKMTVNLPHEQNPWGTTLTYGDLFRPTYPQKFENTEYRIIDIEVLGYAAARDNKVFKYEYISKGIEIKSCTFKQGTWIQSGSFLSRKYNANYEGKNLRINETLTGEELKKQYPNQYEALVERIQVIKAGNVLNNFLSGLTKEVKATADEGANSSHGYQVRCVKE